MSTNSSLRYPTFTELYLNTSTLKADPNLRPEKALSYELGLKSSHKAIFTTVSIFYRKTKDAIDKIKRPQLPVPTMENIDDINMAGIEFTQNINLGKDRIINHINLNYAYLIADRKENGFQSIYTLNFLRHKFTTGFTSKQMAGFFASIWYTYKWREGSYQWDKDSPVIEYAPIKLLDLRINYNLKKNRLFLDANNLLNEQYYEFGFVKQPGRWISTGINIKL